MLLDCGPQSVLPTDSPIIHLPRGHSSIRGRVFLKICPTDVVTFFVDYCTPDLWQQHSGSNEGRRRLGFRDVPPFSIQWMACEQSARPAPCHRTDDATGQR